MSLLRTLRIPQLRAIARPVYAAPMSSLPGSTLPGSEAEDDVSYAHEDAQETDDLDVLSDLDDVPPAAPQSAYPPSGTANPVTATRELPPRRNREQYSLYVSSTNNNNILTFTRPDGGPICTVSSGMVGFKNKNRANPEAAHAAAMRIFDRIAKEAEIKGGKHGMLLEVKFKGFAKGREAVYKALLGAEGDIVRPLVNRLTDMTPIKIGGTRAKKARRT